MQLQGNVVALTGATGRLGTLIASALADEGAVVAAIVQDEAAAHRMAWPDGAQGHAFVADVTDEASVQACFAEIAQRLGRLDAFIHTVGAWRMKPFLETSLDAWEALVAINLTSAFLCFREAARLMQERGGRLIGIASGQGADRGRAQQAAYSAAKGGLVRLVEAVAEELGDTGITAHAVAPSMIRFGPEGERAEGQGAGVPAGQLVQLCVYLCTDAGAALNGATLRAYGA